MRTIFGDNNQVKNLQLTKNFVLRLTEDDSKSFHNFCKENHLKKSEVMRKGVRMFVDSFNESQAKK